MGEKTDQDWGGHTMGDRCRRVVRARRDDGVTLVEVMVAITILALLTASVGIALLSIQRTAFKSKQRAAAANLATREMELVRNWFHSSDTAPSAVMAAGDVTNADPLPGQTGAAVVDGVPYTVKRQVAWLVTGNGVSACDGGSIVSYPSVSVHVVVTWPNMGDVKPVTTDSILTPPKSVLNATTAYYAVKVLNRDGLPSEGRTVQVSGPSGTQTDQTGPDGCATFLVSTAGSYTASLTEGASGYVSYTGVTTATAALSAGTLTVRSFSYDLGESFTATLKPPTGFALPTTKPVLQFANSGIQPSGIATYASNASGVTTVGPVWPFATGYSVWAGSCAGSDPALLGGRPAPLVPSKGSTTSVDVPLQGVAITTTYQGFPVNVPVTATYSGTGTCTSSDGTLALGTSSSGVLNVALPYGQWTLNATINGLPVSDVVVLSPTSGDTSLLNAS
jgi:prepilin-type N-terminal cleavage/methylation domain-containing protein